ncbi:hypothetical protein EVJ58_g9593 [Rhodofomes roseus]|uniref:Fungal-type protein kinase domain-containing protein n=1 Tax=Rhodofomes roseus TaxID=34475 RepID=A0A4Y9XUX8_9APHY|nr:hypothetical protein EVJ58_g9593 [Rhodofomes roseus]
MRKVQPSIPDPWLPGLSQCFIDRSTPQCPRAFFALYFSSAMQEQDSDVKGPVNAFTSAPAGPNARARTPNRGARSTGNLPVKITPTHPSTHDTLYRSDGISRNRHHTWVLKHFRDKIVWNVDPEKFVKAVWDFTFDDIPRVPFPGPGRPSRVPPSYKLQATSLQQYVFDSRERPSYGPLSELANSLLRQMYGSKSTTGRIPRKFPAQYMVRDRNYDDDSHTKEMLDLSFSTANPDGGQRPRWDFEAAFVEVKRTRLAPPPIPSQLATISEQDEGVAQAGKRKRPSAEEDPRTAVQTTKRGGRDAAEEVAAQPEEAEVSNNVGQAVRYMNDIMSANVRSFGIGWLVEDEHMRLLYGDRMGVVITKKFRFLHEDQRLFALCIGAMGRASVHGMGIFPDLHFPANEQEEASMNTYEGAQLRMTARRPDVPNSEEFQFDVDVEAGRIYTEFGVLGRGTSVIPIRATPDTDTSKDPAFKDKGLVAKISWPHALRRAEDSLITAVRRELRAKKPAYLRHVVELKCSVTRTLDEINLPRLAMGLRPDETDERVCRTLILARYQRLEEIGSVERFKIVYIDVVRAHHWVWTTSGILHRDISTNNIMWYLVGDTIYGVLCDWDLAEKNVHGRIPSNRTHAEDEGDSESSRSPSPTASQETDGTAASSKSGTTASSKSSTAAPSKSDKDAESQESDCPKRPRYRTGTGPFMAVDLLRTEAPPFHLYRHDLESFFYVLIYVCAVYNLAQMKFGHLIAWECETLVEIGNNKRNFLDDALAYDTMFANCDPAFKPLVASSGWVRSLYKRFGKVEYLGSSIRRIHMDADTGDELDADEIERYEELRAREITYEKFMQILGAPEDIPVDDAP